MCCITTTVSTPSTWHANAKAPQHIVGHPAAGVADHERFTEMQAEGGEHVDAGVHARDHREAPTGAGISDVRTGRGVSLVGVEKVGDLRHADLIRRSVPTRANGGTATA